MQFWGKQNFRSKFLGGRALHVQQQKCYNILDLKSTSEDYSGSSVYVVQTTSRIVLGSKFQISLLTVATKYMKANSNNNISGQELGGRALRNFWYFKFAFIYFVTTARSEITFTSKDYSGSSVHVVHTTSRIVLGSRLQIQNVVVCSQKFKKDCKIAHSEAKPTLLVSLHSLISC